MDIIDPIWHVKLVSIGTDGKHTMMGYVSSVQMQFEVEASILSCASGVDCTKSTLSHSNKLQLFAGSLASMFPNTATVELDFSIIGAEKNVYHQSLTNFSLEGILHTKQFKVLPSMSTK